MIWVTQITNRNDSVSMICGVNNKLNVSYQIETDLHAIEVVDDDMI